jgi:NADH-quinone oxidoreductase subunit A
LPEASDSFTTMSNSIDYVAIFIQFLVAAGFVVTTIIATHLLGPKRRTSEKLEAFESGIESVGNARIPFSIKYFLAAILFVMFDVEVIFMYPWAVNFKTLGMIGFVEMTLFILTLFIGLVYVLKKGALKWE